MIIKTDTIIRLILITLLIILLFINQNKPRIQCPEHKLFLTG